MAKSTKSRLHCNIDLAASGKQFGELQLRHSDNKQSLGYYPVPIISLVNGPGPTALLIAGVHGDEFEGPVSIMRLVHTLSIQSIKGRIILLPALNMAAVEATSRISPLDHVNLNRAFPGDTDGGPTAQLASYVEELLIPISDLVIDIHAGGKASVFAPCALPNQSSNRALFKSNLALARQFGTPLAWMLNANNDNRSVNAAADRKNIPMIAAELGGGGGCDPDMADLAETGIQRCLRHAGILVGESDLPPAPRIVEIKTPAQNLYAPCRGLFDRRFNAGEDVVQGRLAGSLIPLEEPQRDPLTLRFAASGVVLAHSNRGYVEKGDMLGMIATDMQLSADVAW